MNIALLDIDNRVVEVVSTDSFTVENYPYAGDKVEVPISMDLPTQRHMYVDGKFVPYKAATEPERVSTRKLEITGSEWVGVWTPDEWANLKRVRYQDSPVGRMTDYLLDKLMANNTVQLDDVDVRNLLGLAQQAGVINAARAKQIQQGI